MNEINLELKSKLKEEHPLPILLYDHECSLCQRFRDSLCRLAGNNVVSTVSIHQEEIYEVYPQLDKQLCNEELHLIVDEQTILSGSEALQWLIAKLPGVSKFAWLIESNAGKKSIDFFNEMASKYRKVLLDRCPSCKKQSYW
ncbi:MAG: DUF393 domain-containing protein [Bacteriovoracaceae bacterium]|nr:DUF393 domain-containing protein [Bacteriovoracaceae bacterium]